MISYTYENFVGVYENVLDAESCQLIIEYFESLREFNLVIGYEGYTNNIASRKDETVFTMHPDVITLPKSHPILQQFSEKFWICYEQYCKEYSILTTIKRHGFFQLRIQRTDVGGGFHNWHFENDSIESSNRLVAFMLYLNDVEEGGETEFLYLHKRYQAKSGRMLMWPATYSHTHRGNPPLSNTKYIITAWLNYFE